MLEYIKDPKERECIQYAHKHVPLFTNLFRQPVQRLDYYLKQDYGIIILQPPLIDYAYNQKHNDWTINVPSLNICIRYEVSSLKVTSTLKNKAIQHLIEAMYMPEDLMVLILIGKGYDDIIEYFLRPEIEKKRLPVTIMRTMEQYKKHIDYLFRPRF